MTKMLSKFFIYTVLLAASLAAAEEVDEQEEEKATAPKEAGVRTSKSKVLLFTPEGSKRRPRVLVYSKKPDDVSSAPISLPSSDGAEDQEDVGSKRIKTDPAKVEGRQIKKTPTDKPQGKVLPRSIETNSSEIESNTPQN